MLPRVYTDRIVMDIVNMLTLESTTFNVIDITYLKSRLEELLKDVLRFAEFNYTPISFGILFNSSIDLFYLLRTWIFDIRSRTNNTIMYHFYQIKDFNIILYREEPY